MTKNKGFVTTEGFYDSPVMLGASRITLERKDITMPIAGLTEINRPPRQGMLRLGIKKQTASGKEYPSEVDYFILDPETPDPVEKQRLIDLFHKEFGEKPKTIQICLPSSDLDEVFPQNYKRYGRNTSLKCIGDGESAIVTENAFAVGLDQTGKNDKGMMKVKCDGRECIYAVTREDNRVKECKATATLSVDIYPLGGMGVWQVTTGSFNSIVNINSCIRSIVAKYGRAHALPLILERRPQETTFKGKKAIHYTLHINTDKTIGEMVKQAQIAPDQVLIEAYGEQVSLPAPAEIMDDDTHQPEDKLHKDSGAKGVGMPENVKEAVTAVPPGEEKQVMDTEKPRPAIIVNCPPVGYPDDKNIHPEEEAEIDRLANADKEAGEKAIAKVEEHFPGSTVVSVAKEGHPETFWEFMPWAQAKFRAAGKLGVYKAILQESGVKVLSELKDNAEKQAKVRRGTEAELEREGL